MERKKLIGLICCVALICIGFAFSGHISLYFNLAALCIVIGGTLGATLISFKIESLKNLYQVLKRSNRQSIKEPEEIVEILIDISVKSRVKGLLSLQEEEETSILFLRRALGFLVDGYPNKEITEILNTEMAFFKIRREESERILRTIAEICPAFGLIGSIVGLIGMIAGMADSAIIIKTIPIALTSTLYGVIFSNFFLLPFAANIRERTNRELLLQKMILSGILAVKSKMHPRILEVKLKSFLTPSLRNSKLVSIERIRKKLNIDINSTKKPSTAYESSIKAAARG
ncbi:MAG: MotA/TolQ/ExbB proton channel family protein [Desulfobacterales bacterium]|nr:MotA/TolQ/ExbB proton channel family protein [Desulfobacterales bacterium]